MTTLNASTLRPGLLVSLSTSILGNARYEKTPVKTEIVDGKEIAEWETKREIADAAEYEAAKSARNKAGHCIRSICTNSAFGLLCPEADAEVLAQKMGEARKICEEFNASAKVTRIGVYVIAGRIASDDVEAVKAINSEVRGLLELMEEGIKNADVKTIRDAAAKAKEMGQMLSPDAAAKIQIAVESAREAAKKIVKAGEQAAIEVDTIAIRKLTEARTSFLDIDDAGEVQAPQAEGRALDLAPAVEIKAIAPQAAAIEI